MNKKFVFVCLLISLFFQFVTWPGNKLKYSAKLEVIFWKASSEWCNLPLMPLMTSRVFFKKTSSTSLEYNLCSFGCFFRNVIMLLLFGCHLSPSLFVHRRHRSLKTNKMIEPLNLNNFWTKTSSKQIYICLYSEKKGNEQNNNLHYSSLVKGTLLILILQLLLM